MKSIKQLQSIKFDKEGYEFIDEIADVREIWGLFVNTFNSEHNNSYTDFKINVNVDLVGTVVLLYSGGFECNLNRIDFQDEYSEDELKALIIKDIENEYIKEFVPVKNGYRNWFSDIKEHDDDFTKLTIKSNK